MPSLLSLFLLLLLAITFCGGNANSSGARLVVEVHNWSDGPIQINWINPSTREASYLSDVDEDTYYEINTFAGHEFELREMPDEDTGACGSDDDETCHIAYLTVSDEEEQQYRVLSKMVVTLHEKYDPYEWLDDEDEDVNGWKEMESPSLEDCRNLLQERLQLAKEKTANSAEADESAQYPRLEAFDAYYACLEAFAAPSLDVIKNEIEFEREIRTKISGRMETITCRDDTVQSSPDVHVRTWNGSADGVERTIHVKLDRPASRIHVIENFVSQEECDDMEEDAMPTMGAAFVSDGSGGIEASAARKARQGGIDPEFEEDHDEELSARVAQRVYAYASHVLNKTITYEGQEQLVSIQYAGRGYDDVEPDQYKAHCDGACDGERYSWGTRAATMLMYCTIPEHGGHTNFQNANVHVKPERGAAVFFSYINTETDMMDKGLTQHSGCPTFEGEKKIVTQWIRLGVTEDEPWTRLNTRRCLRDTLCLFGDWCLPCLFHYPPRSLPLLDLPLT